MCLMVSRSGMLGVLRVVYCNEEGWGFCVLLSVWILPKLLVNCFVYGVVLFDVKFVHMYVLLVG
jgi:hypothetical protein